jgi:hypothetical protein
MYIKSDIITCYNYRDLADYCWEPPDNTDIPDVVVVWISMNNIPDFFNKIKGSGRKYILISSFCDYGLALQKDYPVGKDWIEWLHTVFYQLKEPNLYNIGYNNLQLPVLCQPSLCSPTDKYVIRVNRFTFNTISEIPSEIYKWYLSNNLVPRGIDDRLITMPFGIQKDMETLWVNQIDHTPKMDKLYCNWQNHSSERVEATKWLQKLYWAFVRNEPIPQDQYREELKQYRYILCPNGIGPDCYRTLEALYCGCIPVVHRNNANINLGLPVILYDDFHQISQHWLTTERRETINRALFEDCQQIKLSYWRSHINQSRQQLLKGI